jgi:chromosome segregation ATPase
MRRAHRELDQLSDFLTGTPDAFFPDEAAQEARETHHDLRDRTAKLETQVLAQYTAMAAYASIAKNDTDALRSEVKHDLERSQSTLIGLVERVRAEVGSTSGVAGAAALERRIAELEDRFDALASALERSIQTQQALAEQVNSLLAERTQRDGWLVASGGPDALSLH